MQDMPVFLVCEEMLASIDEQLAEINKYTDPSPANFLYSYSLFEGLLRELSFQLYYSFPKKLKGLCEEVDKSKKIEIEKDKLLLTNDYYFVLNSVIDKKLNNLSKDSIHDFLKFFTELAAIKLTLAEDLLKNMKIVRNIIAHSNSYNIKPWNIESRMFGEILREDYLQKYHGYIVQVIRSIRSELANKYASYTYEKLLIASWNYTCPKRLSIYDVFDFSKGTASVLIEKATQKIQTLSRDEKYLVSVWLENHNIEIMYQIMSKVGEVNSAAHISVFNELRYLHQLFRQYPYLVSGQNYKVENAKIII